MDERDKKPVPRLAHGRKIIVKKTLGEKIHDFFFEDGTTQSMTSDFVENVVKPAFNDMVYDMFMDFTDMIRGSFENMWFNGSMSNYSRSRYSRGRRYGYRRSYDDYYYDRRDDRDDRREDRRRLSRRNDSVAAMVPSRDEAKNVVLEMQERCRECDDPEQYVSVTDFYVMCDMPAVTSNDSSWGWNRRNPFEASIRYFTDEQGDGYVIEPSKPTWFG